jgi:flotillin
MLSKLFTVKAEDREETYFEKEKRLEKEKAIRRNQLLIKVGMATCAAAALVAVAMRVKISGPSQYVVRTGLGIRDISVTKNNIQWPFQKAHMMSIEPVTFPIEVDAMSIQRIPFRMPSVWTIGPKNEQKSLENYARLLMDKGNNGVHDTMQGVIQGEIRVLTANLDLNQLFSDRDKFKNAVVDKINTVVEPFGLIVYNANIAELTDLDKENQYFSEQKRRALMKINQDARVDVAEAIKDGEVGERNFQSEARQGIAKAEKEAKLVEYQRDQEVAESLKNLQVAKATYQKETAIAQINATAEAEERQWKLQKGVEERRKEQELEKKRADLYTTTTVQAEIAIKEAEGEAQSIRVKADAELYAQQQVAEGIKALRQAEAEGLQLLIKSAGDVDGLNRYLMIRDNLLPELADKQAKALQGLNPRISVWQTGEGTKGLNGTLTDLFKTGMPLFDGIKEQTGYDFMKRLGFKENVDDKKDLH